MNNDTQMDVSQMIQTTDRASLPETLMQVAEVIAQRSTCNRLHVGAVIARDTRVISTGYNGVVAGAPHCNHTDDTPCSQAVHAEANAIVFAARTGIATDKADAFFTHAPCVGCARLLINAGISRVYYRNQYRNLDGIEALMNARVWVKPMSLESYRESSLDLTVPSFNRVPDYDFDYSQ